MSIPFGPIGALALHRILHRGAIAGIASGLGVALGDSFFAALAVLGVTQVTEFLMRNQQYFALLGGVLILIYGIRNMKSSPPVATDHTQGRGMHFCKDMGSLFLVTVANPQTVIGFSAALVGLVHFYELRTTQDALLLIAGVFCGSMLWWIGLSMLLDKWRSRLSADFTAKLNYYAAIVVMVVGVLLILHALNSAL